MVVSHITYKEKIRLKFYTGIGSRETPNDVLLKMTNIAKHFNKLGYTLRSGGAGGADSAFEDGADLKEIYLPWQGFRGKRNDLSIHPDAERIAKEFHPAWNKLTQAGRAFHTRNVHQILGQDLKTPTDLVVCWTKDGKASGGTGQALRIALQYKIPIYNLFNYEDIVALGLFIKGQYDGREKG